MSPLVAARLAYMLNVKTASDDVANKPEMAPQLADLAATLKAAGDALRLEVLRALAKDSYGVLELCAIFEIKQSGMSHHLKVLANAGLVASRREGNSIFYRRAYLKPQEPMAELQQQLFTTLDKTPTSPQVEQRLKRVQAERALASQAFFADNASKFRKQQDLIASYPVYAEQVRDILDQTPLPQQQRALEIGPGEGEFLGELSARFGEVVALDNTPEMLSKAETFVEINELTNVRLIAGDTRVARDQQLSSDCIVVNMVLHHTPSPAEIFQDLSMVLNPGGALLVTDLCRHDQGWAKDNCGDLWQGFDPEDFSRWAKAAGLEEGQSNYFALRNGFQIQIRLFFKPLNS